MSSINPVLISCCIDYLCFYLSVYSRKRKDILTTNIQMIANAISKKENIAFNQVLYSKAGYALSIRLPLFTEITHTGSNNETPHLFIQLDPRKEYRPFFKCEVKGHPLTKRQWLCVRLWLELLLSQELYNKLMLKAKVSKIDLAADFNLDIEDFLFDRSRAQKGGVFYGKGGKIETIYIGDSKSGYLVCIYCRRSKLKQLKKPITDAPITRVETRLKLESTNIFEIIDSVGFGRPFSKFTIYDFCQMRNSKIVCDSFLDLSRAVGIKPVLQKESQVNRRKIRRELKRFEVLLVDEELIMKSFRENARKLDVLGVDFDMDTKQPQKTIKRFKNLYNVR